MAAATARWQRDAHGWEVPESRIHPIASVLTGLELAIERFSPPGAPVIVPTPAYMPFLTIPEGMGREVVEVPMALADGRYRYDLDGIDRAFRAGAGLLVLCNPCNPVGRVFERAELEALADIVERHGGRVFADEVHAPIVYPGAAHLPYASISETAAGHAVTATSASKAWNLPGLKAAQLILSSDADAETWERTGGFHGASTLGVIAQTAAYDEGRDWLGDIVGYLDGTRRLLGELIEEHLPGIGYTAPEGSYIAWLDTRGLGLGEPAAFFQERAGVALTEGAWTGAAGTGFMRFVFATPRPIVEEAVVRMGRALRSR